MEIDELIDRYPLLYHMAERGSWPSIRTHGLRSTSSLLDLFEIRGNAREQYESQRRAESMTISHECFGKVVLRDNKPLSDARLEKVLQGGLSLRAWYRTLNRKVFFWPIEERLITFLSASSYKDRTHDVITVRTADLVSRYADSIWLSPMNSGTTMPFAWARGRATFKRIKSFPYTERKTYGRNAVAELAVDGLVDGVEQMAESVVIRRGRRRVKTIWRP